MANINLNHVLAETDNEDNISTTGQFRADGNGGVGNVTAGTPTAAQLTATFGSPEDVGNGFIAFNDDAGGDTSVQLVVSNGTSWFFTAALTKAS